MIKKFPGDKAGWKELVEKFPGKVGSLSSSPAELMKTWAATFFKPFQGLAGQKWGKLNLNKSFDILGALQGNGSLIPKELEDLTKKMNDYGKTFGADGPDATGLMDILKKIHEFQEGTNFDGSNVNLEGYIEDVAEDFGVDDLINFGESSNY